MLLFDNLGKVKVILLAHISGVAYVDNFVHFGNESFHELQILFYIEIGIHHGQVHLFL